MSAKDHLLNRLRSALYFRILRPWARVGRNVHVQWSTTMWSPHRHIVIGNDVGIGGNCYFLADTEIGNKVLIAACCAFLNRDDHVFNVVGKAMWDSGRGDKFKIVVEDDVWIGHGAVILSRVRIGRGSIVAANSVVTKDVPRYAVVAGSPASVVRMRFSEAEILEHEKLLAERGEL